MGDMREVPWAAISFPMYDGVARKSCEKDDKYVT